ncbi:MAG: histidine--tRNA ligase [Dehalococcoidia bacterium]|nr:histidine--tRNA ligase [Dehalococcoidia bacterium]
MPHFSVPRGTADVLPKDQPYWQRAIGEAERLSRLYGYQRIDTPIFEEAALFERGVGDATDIVQKEMYVFEDRSGQRMALRPEGTANVCRAYLQHGMYNRTQPVRLYYIAPTFRYERPQAGRQRQHTQFGCEAIGEDDPAIDAELIELLWQLYENLELRDLVLLLNSIGDPECRAGYLNALQDHYRGLIDTVCRDCRERVERNPLRLLDCKQESCQPVIASAPSILDYLCPACREHFDSLRRYLDALGVPYEIEPRLVRGLDYYTRTVFEIQPRGGGAQSTVGAGGRYDRLIEELGGRRTPGIGFAAGIERIVLNMKRQKAPVPPQPTPDVYVAYQVKEAKTEALALAARLRREGVSAVVATGGRSLRAQMRHADALKARWAVILGQRELAAGTVQLRNMTDASQRELTREEAVAFLGRAAADPQSPA